MHGVRIGNRTCKSGKKKPPSGGLVFFQFFNSNIGYFCMCYLRPYHPVVIAVVDVLCFDVGVGALYRTGTAVKIRIN